MNLPVVLTWMAAEASAFSSGDEGWFLSGSGDCSNIESLLSTTQWQQAQHCQFPTMGWFYRAVQGVVPRNFTSVLFLSPPDCLSFRIKSPL